MPPQFQGGDKGEEVVFFLVEAVTTTTVAVTPLERQLTKKKMSLYFMEIQVLILRRKSIDLL